MYNKDFNLLGNDELEYVNGGGFFEGLASVLVGVGAGAAAVAVAVACPPIAAGAAVLLLFPAGAACVGFGLADVLGNDNISFN